MATKTVYKTYKNLKLPKFNLPKIGGKKLKIFLSGFLGLIFLAVLFFGLMVGLPLVKAKDYVDKLRADAGDVKDAFIERDFDLAQERFKTLNSDLSKFDSYYNSKLRILNFLPYSNKFYADGIHALKAGSLGIDLAVQTLDILKPFSAQLGFKNSADGDEIDNKTRILNLVEILPEISNDLSRVLGGLSQMDKELSYIDETKYPETFRGVGFRSLVGNSKTLVHEMAVKAPSFDQMFKVLPDLLGVKEPKTYMLFMANNYELRMSGGFNTYLVLVKIDKGIPEVVTSVDTYNIDRDKSYLVYRNVPWHLRDYLLVTRFYARDATSNSPDFKMAVDEFLNKFWKVDWTMPQDFDGVIQVNNFVVEDLLKVVGPVEAGGFNIKHDQDYYINVPVQEFNFENVIMELEKIAGGDLAETIGRKDIIKYLMLNIMNKALNTPAENLGQLVEVMFRELNQKNIMIYSFDPGAEEALEGLGYAGRIVPIPAGYDYLHVSNSNYGAGKRDWLIRREVFKENKVEDGKKVSVIKMKTINPKSPEWFEWFPFYRDYFRFYVPLGTRLISAQASDGQELNAKEIDDLGRTAIEGFFKMEENTEITVTVKVEIPDSVDFDNYNLIVQKQSGTWGDPYSIAHKGSTKKFDLLTDKEISF